MNLRRTVAAAAVLGASAVCILPFTASASTPTASAADKTFARTNEQTNLAEITLGKMGVQRAQTPAAKVLAEMTLKQHEMLKSHLQHVASVEGFSLPTQPNGEEKEQAAKLRRISDARFDHFFVKYEIKGHLSSIAGTKFEIVAGHSSLVKDYARYYLPYALHHLALAEAAQS